MKRALLATFCCGAAWAHVGGQVSLAKFTQPPPLLTSPDGGVTAAAIPQADTSYGVTWADGDFDPTGRYFFYYMDRPPPSGMSTAAVADEAIPLPDGPVYSSCDCVDGPGLTCPDAGVRDCRNGFTWDTSALPAGAWWLIAIDNDPPYYLYSISESPLRVGHGTPAPPGALFIKPNGIGSADESYLLEWVAAGEAPLDFDLSWGENVEPRLSNPPTSIAKKVAATDEGQGRFSYLWDTSQLPTGDVFVQLTARDPQGRSSVTNSLNLKIFHAAAPPDLSRPDLAMTVTPPSSGCEVSSTSDGSVAALFAGAVLALLLGFLARRSTG